MTVQHYDDLLASIERGDGYAVIPDVAISLARYINREWGSDGYRMRFYGLPGGGAYALVSHSDGSRFIVSSDRWSNCSEVKAS
jgi:hypothetical protein